MQQRSFPVAFHKRAGPEAVQSQPARIDILAMVDGDLDQIDEHDTVIVRGGLNVQHHVDKRLVNWLRKAARRGMDIGAVCTGAHILAEVHILDDYRCTIHWENQRPSWKVTISACHCPPVSGRAIPSSSTSSRRWRQSRRALIAERAGPPGGSFGPPPRTPVPALSRPLAQMILPRIEAQKARSLLLQTGMSVINVALACGFSSPSHFSKCYRAFYGRIPYRERGVPVLGHRYRLVPAFVKM
jgi:hypothetical protein